MKTINNLIYIFTIILFYSHFSIAQNKLEFEAFEKKADNYIQALFKSGQFSGNVLVANKEKIIFNKSYGWSSKRFGVLNNASTKFRIASMTKSFAAISVLQLVEKGKLSLEDKISKFLDYPSGDKISIKHLLSHSSGIKRDIHFPNEHKKYSLKELINFSKDSPLFKPGTKTAYSNINYILLQYILEKVENIDFETYVTNNVIIPLGLKNTGIEHPMSPPIYLAQGYGPGVDKYGNFEIQEKKMLSHSYSDAVTALYSTTEDMYKFCQQLGKSPILKEETWQLAFEPVIVENPMINWGLGFTIIGNKKMNIKVLNHNGRTTGFKGGFYQDLKDELTIIVLGNYSEVSRGLIVNTLQSILENREYYQPNVHTKIEIDSGLLKEYIGEFKTENFIFEITEFNNQLYIQSHGDAPSLINPYKKDSFFSEFFDLNISFKRKNGIVTEAEWKYNGKSINGIKK